MGARPRKGDRVALRGARRAALHCDHLEHRFEPVAGRWIGYDSLLGEWQPCDVLTPG